jgi:hypothetical protein
MRWALATGTTLFAVGSAVLALRPDTGQKLPDLAFPSLDGETMQLSQIRGKPTVVNLWATWCPPCVREMPVLAQRASRTTGHPLHLPQSRRRSRPGEELAAGTRSSAAKRAHRRATPGERGVPASWLSTTLFFAASGRLVSRRIGELSAATLKENLQRISQRIAAP